MSDRLPVAKTYKLFIAGKFPRGESGRTLPVGDAQGVSHVARASRKDLRDAVEAARKAQPAWADATPYLRGQILYRLAEMVEGKREELAAALHAIGSTRPASKGSRSLAPDREVALTVDRLVSFAGWADKFAQVLGCNNAVAGPYYNFTVPEATGVVGVIAPDAPALLALVSLLAPAWCAGNAVVALASTRNPIPASILAEAIATCDCPPGVVNVLTGERDELIPHFARHGDIDAIHAAGVDAAQGETLRAGAGDNLKRVCVRARVDWKSPACADPWWIEPFVEMKTIWHPSAT